MNIIFISATCARADYEDICRKRKYPLLDSSQKFFEMFLSGLAQQEEVSVDCITVRPISRGTYPGLYIPARENQEGKVRYHYVPIWNFPGVKTLFAIASVKSVLKRLIRKYGCEDTRIICDPLLLEGLVPAAKLGRKHGILTAGFLTDMPDFADECDEHGKIKSMMYKAYNQLINKSLDRLDRHIVLTEAMRCVAGDKPWLLLDCIVDEHMLDGLSAQGHEDGKPHVLYAGKLHKEFGLDLLGEAMQRVKSDCIFDIYGDGNYKDELQKIASTQNNIRLHGIVPLKEVLRAELGATVLINPRTSAGEFTKYSFPSKTAEYMLAGVPVVMFRLPGVSSQYEDYIQYADEETAESFAQRIDAVLEMNAETREKVGSEARRFVMENKNNIKQAYRVLTFLG